MYHLFNSKRKKISCIRKFKLVVCYLLDLAINIVFGSRKNKDHKRNFPNIIFWVQLIYFMSVQEVFYNEIFFVLAFFFLSLRIYNFFRLFLTRISNQTLTIHNSKIHFIFLFSFLKYLVVSVYSLVFIYLKMPVIYF